MKRVLFFSTAFLALFASCATPADDVGGNPDDPKQPGDNKPPVARAGSELKTGTRLRARFVNGDDGSQAAIGHYDSKLNVECQFSEAEDGKTRCLPTRTATLRTPDTFASNYSGARFFYKDNNCTERLAVSNLCEAPARYVKFQDTCGGRPRIANINEIAVPATIYFRSYTGACSGASTAGQWYFTELRFYTLGAPVQPEEFVAGTIATE